MKTEFRPSISGPYDFQHVSHTDQGHFQSLNKVSKLELVHEFTAVQEQQAPADEIKGIAVSDLPSTESSPSAGIPPASPTSSTLPALPTTPPRPAPPPKDTVSTVPKTPDVRMSRSTENFSRPTRSPVATRFNVSPIHELDMKPTSGSPVSVLETVPPSPFGGWVEETFDKLALVTSSRRESATSGQVSDKPLPPPPSIVHAVSTNDESALPMPTTPLPDLPAAGNPFMPESKDESIGYMTQGLLMPHRVSLRHAQSFPTTKLARRRSQSSGDIPFVSSFASTTALPTSGRRSRRISIGLKKIDIEDWEDAIDYAWDHPLDLEDDLGVPPFEENSLAKTPASRPESFLVVHQAPSAPVSQPTTPLMMQGPTKPLPTPGPTKSLPAIPHYSGKVSLRGLGIRQNAAQLPAAEQSHNRLSKRESYVMPPVHPMLPALRREPGSPMSKSSSQESIILSIASSIMGTHRSSNSSTSLSDFSSTFASFEDKSETLLPTRFETQPAIVHQTATTTHGIAVPTESPTSNTSDSSQETVKSEVAPALPTQAPSLPPVEEMPLSPLKRVRTTSISAAAVPNRTSSVAASAAGRATRSRSNTLTHKQRYNPSRASYSLFPTAQAPPPPAPATTTS